jgi:DinB superfamily
MTVARCDECAFDPSAFADTDLGAEVRRLGSRYRVPLTRLLPGEDDGVLRRRPTAQVWSALEYAGHVRDVFFLFARRIDQLVTEDQPALEVVDHDRAVTEGRYGNADPARIADEIAEAAAVLAARLDALAPEEWARSGTQLGEVRTVRDVAQRGAHEGHHHLLDVGRVLRAARGR